MFCTDSHTPVSDRHDLHLSTRQHEGNLHHKQQLRRQRRESYLYALELQKEHEKARHFHSLSPEEKQEIHREAELVEQGCQRLGALLQRLGLDRYYSAMRASSGNVWILRPSSGGMPSNPKQ